MLRLCIRQDYDALPDDTRIKLLDEVWQPTSADLKAVRQLQRNLVVQLSPITPHLRPK